MKEKIKGGRTGMNRSKRKKRWVVLVVAVMMIEMFAAGGGLSVYGATEITGLEALGDSVSKTHSDSQNWTFTSPIKASYMIELFGPAGNGQNAGNGGYVTANIVLEEGQTIEVYLGPGAPTASGSGAAGHNGSGYGDTGVYKATVTSGETTLMVAGGGGSEGNAGANGAGNGYINGYTTNKSCQSAGCSINNGYTMHCPSNVSGNGGAGGKGADGGGPGVTNGNTGNPGAASGWFVGTSGQSGTGVSVHAFRTGGGQGGKGGNGGASYTNPLYCISPMMSAGISVDESKITITMGAEVLPPFDSKLLIDVKNEILEAIVSRGGITAGGNAVPEITVVAGKPFQRMVAAYADMANGSANGITVENNDKENQTINLTGTLQTTGDREIVIHDRSFLFHVVSEPNSANVMVVFD